LRRLLVIPFLFALLLIFSGEISAAESVGKVKHLDGRADVMRGGRLPASKLLVGMEIFRTDIIRTKRDAKVEVVFHDGNIIHIGERSRVDVTGYYLDGKGGNSQVIKLTRGKIRSVVNRHSPVKVNVKGKKKFEIHTMNAVAGVRGTDFVVLYNKGVTGIVTTKGLLYVFNRFIPNDVKDIPAGSARVIKLKKTPGNLQKLSEGQLNTIIKELTPKGAGEPDNFASLNEKTDDSADQDGAEDKDSVEDDDGNDDGDNGDENADDDGEDDGGDNDSVDNTADETQEDVLAVLDDSSQDEAANDYNDTQTQETNSVDLSGKWDGNWIFKYYFESAPIFWTGTDNGTAKAINASGEYQYVQSGGQLQMDNQTDTVYNQFDSSDYYGSYTYTAWGVWSNTDTIFANTIRGETPILWVVGRNTEAAEIPQNGSVTYNGQLQGYWTPTDTPQGASAINDFYGEIQINIDFTSKLVSGNMTLHDTNPSEPWMLANFSSITLNADGTYNGNVSGTYLDTSTSYLKGRLYGPNAQETGGIFLLHNTDSVTAEQNEKRGYLSGQFRAKQ